MLMLDLCSGLGGASQAMRDRGWRVVRVDIDPQYKPDIVADITTCSYCGPTPTLVWASPPCRGFSRHSMPWLRPAKEPDLSIVMACKRIINESRPMWWVVENVRGAVPFLMSFLGRPSKIINPYYLWGNFPPFEVDRARIKNKERLSSTQAAQRALIPYEISEKLALACEQQLPLLLGLEGGDATE